MKVNPVVLLIQVGSKQVWRDIVHGNITSPVDKPREDFFIGFDCSMG